MKMRNSILANFEPCGTPDLRVSALLLNSFTSVNFFLSFKNSLNMFRLFPYNLSFSDSRMRRSKSTESDAFYRYWLGQNILYISRTFLTQLRQDARGLDFSTKPNWLSWIILLTFRNALSLCNIASSKILSITLNFVIGRQFAE